MSFDNSRFTFDPWKDYWGVVMEQGRVQLDSDWNEWLAELARRSQAGALDTVGRAGYPTSTPNAFKITAWSDTSGNHISIGAGRMYVDGLLAENHGPGSAAQWDPALDELSGAPQPPGPTVAWDFTQQPYLPGVTLSKSNGPFLAYLDVWRRPVTYVQDTDLVDKAVGVDTTGRLQTVWQVKLLDVSSVVGVSCDNAGSIPDWQALLQPPAGQLTNGLTGSSQSGPCGLAPNAGFTGVENQFYRVQIHRKGKGAASSTAPTTYPLPAGGHTATFKWSRDNASVITRVSGITTVTNTAGNPASQLRVDSLGRDQVLGFAPGNWIEITDDILELNGLTGELHLIASIDDASKTITLDSTVSSTNFPVTAGKTDSKRHTRITRWDQSGKVYEADAVTVWVDLSAPGSTGDIPVPPPGTKLILESGITVAFGLNLSSGSFRVGDFWTFSARTADGSIDPLTQAFPRGIYHHYAKLAVVTFPSSAQDCRCCFPSLTDIGGVQVIKVLAKDSYDHDVPLSNGTELQADTLTKGLRLILNHNLLPATLNEPACFVTFQLPYPLIPLNPVDQHIWGTSIIGYQPLVLPADVTTNSANTVFWKPFDDLGLFFAGPERLVAMRRRRVPAAFQRDWQVVDPPQSPPAPGQTYFLPSHWDYQEDSVVQTTLAGHTPGGVGWFGLNTNSLSVQKLGPDAYYIGLTVSPGAASPAAPLTYQNVGLIFNWISENDYFLFRCSWSRNATGDESFDAEILHVVNGQLHSSYEDFVEQASAPGGRLDTVSLNIKLTRNGLLFRIKAEFAGDSGTSSLDRTFIVPDKAMADIPHTLLEGSRTGLATRFATAKFTRLEVIYPNTRAVLVPDRGSRILANLALKRNFIQPLNVNESGIAVQSACAPLLRPDFEQWFWVVPPIPRYDYYGYSFPGFLGFGSELLNDDSQ